MKYIVIFVLTFPMLMKKAFKPKAVVSLLADGNRDINGNHYCCYHPYMYHYFNALFHFTKGIQGLLQEVYIFIGAKKNTIRWISTGAYSLIVAGDIQEFTGERNACYGLIAENKQTISYQNKIKLPMI